MHWKAPVPESTLLKKSLSHKISKNTIFTEHLWPTDSGYITEI